MVNKLFQRKIKLGEFFEKDLKKLFIFDDEEKDLEIVIFNFFVSVGDNEDDDVLYSNKLGFRYLFGDFIVFCVSLDMIYLFDYVFVSLINISKEEVWEDEFQNEGDDEIFVWVLGSF